MAKDYNQIAESVVEKVGGIENIKSVTHCINRLRFVLRDESKADTAGIKHIQGVLDVVLGNGQYQVVIGTDVEKAYDAVIAKVGTGLAGGEVAADPGQDDAPKEKSFFSTLTETISGIFMPAMGGMAAVGLIKAILVVLSNLSLIDTSSGTYIILYAASDAFMQFLPFVLAYSSAEKFGCNKYTALAVVAPLLYSTITSAYSEGAALYFLGIPVTLMNYQQSVMPAIFTVFLLSKLKPIINKIVPSSLKFFLAPGLCVLIMVPLELIVIGPISMVFGNAFAAVFQFIYNLAPIPAAMIYGALYPVLIIFGAHWAIVPIMTNNIAVLGYDWISPLSFGCTYAIAGACLGVFLKTHDRGLKEMAGTNTVVAIFAGVTEPAIYGVTLKYKRPFIVACISSGIAAIFICVAGYQRLAFVGLNIFTIPALAMYPGGWSVPVCVIASFVLALVGTLLFGFDDSMIAEEDRTEDNREAKKVKAAA